MPRGGKRVGAGRPPVDTQYRSVIDMAKAAAPEAFQRLIDMSSDKTVPAAIRKGCNETIVNRAYGTAPSFNTSDHEALRKALEMTDEEIATRINAIAAGRTGVAPRPANEARGKNELN